jgi:hypothetical protein
MTTKANNLSLRPPNGKLLKSQLLTTKSVYDKCVSVFLAVDLENPGDGGFDRRPKPNFGGMVDIVR